MKPTINKFFAAALLITTGLFTGNRAAAQTSGLLFNEITHLDSLQFDALMPGTLTS
jgi:hypothetical protein